MHIWSSLWELISAFTTHGCYGRVLSCFLSDKNKPCAVFHMLSGLRSVELEKILVWSTSSETADGAIGASVPYLLLYRSVPPQLLLPGNVDAATVFVWIVSENKSVYKAYFLVAYSRISFLLNKICEHIQLQLSLIACLCFMLCSKSYNLNALNLRTICDHKCFTHLGPILVLVPKNQQWG